MTDLQISMKILAICGVMGIFFSALVHSINLYRFFGLLSIIVFLVGTGMEGGLKTLALVITVMFFIFPIAFKLAANLIVGMAWSNVRKEFPNEPKAPPVTPLTIVSAYRFIWTWES